MKSLPLLLGGQKQSKQFADCFSANRNAISFNKISPNVTDGKNLN